MPRVKTRNRYTFDREQLIKFFDTVSRPKVMIACFISRMCGLRIEEVSRLKWENINFEDRRLEVLNSKWKHRTRDGYGKDRKVRMPKIMIDPVKKWKEIISGGVWVLPSDKVPNRHMTKKALYNQYHDFLKEAGMLELHYTYERTYRDGRKERVNRYKLNYHSLRAYYITDCRKRGLKPEVIAKQAGHDDITTTMGYSRFNDEEMDRMIDVAFDRPVQHVQVIKQPPNPYIGAKQISLNPREELQGMMVRNQISREEYLDKLSLLEPDGIKKTIELKN